MGSLQTGECRNVNTAQRASSFHTIIVQEEFGRTRGSQELSLNPRVRSNPSITMSNAWFHCNGTRVVQCPE